MKSLILRDIVRGDYAAGLVRFEQLKNPTPQDRRWGGVCLMALQRLDEAQRQLLQAKVLGCPQAAIELASIHRYYGESEHSQRLLSSLEATKLTAFDAALWSREWGFTHFALGRHQQAIVEFERGLELALSLSDGQALVAGMRYALALALVESGRSTRALQHIDVALETLHPARRLYAHANRALCLVHLGRLEEAHQELIVARGHLNDAPIALPVLWYYEGLLARARGLYHDATLRFTQAADLARGNNEPETEFYALLGGSAVSIASDKLSDARKQLVRARLLANNPKMNAHLEVREGALLARMNHPEAVTTLEGATRNFQALHMPREATWAQLHLAEAQLRLGNLEAAEATLNTVTDQRHALGLEAALTLELRGLPLTIAYLNQLPEDRYASALRNDWRMMQGQAPLQLRLHTLGSAGITRDGQRVKLNAGITVTLEVLTYLLLHPNSRLECILADVFPEKLPEQAKRYFHLVRTELRQAIPGFSIPFDEQKRTYRVEHAGLNLEWDYADLRRQLEAGTAQAFSAALEGNLGVLLPTSESEWVAQLRDQLEQDVLQRGVQHIEDLFEHGENLTCLTLCQQLLKRHPLEAPLHLHAIRATWALQGQRSAQHQFDHVRRYFEHEVNELPPQLHQFQLELFTPRAEFKTRIM
jgi:tetratricopeptide (TPR) repeat protein/DNA-binding SARP family transcriptional activator